MTRPSVIGPAAVVYLRTTQDRDGAVAQVVGYVRHTQRAVGSLRGPQRDDAGPGSAARRFIAVDPDPARDRPMVAAHRPMVAAHRPMVAAHPAVVAAHPAMVAPHPAVVAWSHRDG